MGRRLSAESGGGDGAGDGGSGLSIEVIVQEVNKSGSAAKNVQPSVWNEYKFLERSFGMRFMHMQV